MVYFSQKLGYPCFCAKNNLARRETLYRVRIPQFQRAQAEEVVTNAKNSCEVICVYDPP